MKKEDINGFWVYEETPITREGVFPYKGKQIDPDGSMGLDPNRKYGVYRPYAEISKPEVLESLNGVQLTDEHEMLGEGQRDVGNKRVAGTVYNVHPSKTDPGVITGTLKIMSKDVKNLIQGGKRQLSCGYYCDYKPQKGTFNGTPYDFVQTNIVGNHVALVKKGRMGEKCAVQDSADMTDYVAEQFANLGRKESQVRGKAKQITCDSAIDITPKEVTFMPNETNYDEMLAKALEGKGVKDKVSIDKIVEFINTLPAPAAEPAKDADDPATAPVAEPAPADATAPAPAAEPVPPVAEPVKDADDPAPAAPADDPAPAPQAITKEEFQAAVDAAVAERYAKEDAGRQLAEDIAPRCGNLWKRGMDADDVAEAACEKLGHKDLPKEARIPFVKAMATESKKAPDAKGSAMDSAFDYVPRGVSSTMAKYLNK